jgi:hypothetical protein
MGTGYAVDTVRCSGYKRSKLPVRGRRPDLDFFLMYEERAGWPMRCCISRGAVVEDNKGLTTDLSSRWMRGVAIPRSPSAGLQPRLVELPLCPLWTGLVVDTTVWTMVVWMVYAGVRRVRRALGEKRGVCAFCGYDRRGLAADVKCPECGTLPAPASK